MVTIELTLKHGMAADAPAAIGRFRVWLPPVISSEDDGVVHGDPVPQAWVVLDGAGFGSVTIPDPRSDSISPRYWAPLVEVDTDAWKASPYPVVIPEDATGPFQLPFLSPIISELAPGVMQVRGPRGPQGAQGPAGATGAQGVAGPTGATGPAGSVGAAGPQGPAGASGADGQDGTLKAYAVKNGITGTFGPAGDGGDWTTCPVAYRSEPCPAEVGDVLRWSPAFYHQSDQESVGDLASLDALGDPIRHLSSGTLVPLGVGHGGLYLAAAGTRVLRQLDWVVAAEDIVAGQVTLVFRYRSNGSGNTMGHVTLPGQVAVVNLGPGGGA
jgi:hypothetical protein